MLEKASLGFLKGRSSDTRWSKVRQWLDRVVTVQAKRIDRHPGASATS